MWSSPFWLGYAVGLGVYVAVNEVLGVIYRRRNAASDERWTRRMRGL